MNSKPKVTVVGLGYVGLPLALAIARSRKYEVFGYDIDEKKLQTLRDGENPLKDESVSFLNGFIGDVDYAGPDEIDKIDESDFFIIAVPNPVTENYEPDYSHIISASAAVAPYMKEGCCVIIETTVNPGTCEEVVAPVLEEGSDLKMGEDFVLTHCPERINPGDPKWNVLNIPRNIGSSTKEGNREAADFYRSIIDAPVYEVSSLKVAEATKIVENTFRDINIAFVNELAMSFDKFGINVLEVIKGSSNKPFGFLPHYPGAGVGGHCIPVDPYFLIKRAKLNGFDHRFLRMAREINNGMPSYTVEVFENGVGEAFGDLGSEGIKVGVLGLSYKPDVGDLRESPAIKIYSLLEGREECEVKFFDPYVEDFKGMNSASSLDSLVEWADALVLVTMHKEFNILPALLKKYSNVKFLVDGRNAFTPSDFSDSLVYRGIGTNSF